MLIGQAAQAAGITTRALRYYEQQGLLAAQRTSSGYRDYSEADVARVRNIRELLRSGFTVEDISMFAPLLDRPVPPTFTVVDAGMCEVALRVAQDRLAVLSERIERLTDLHARLAARLHDQSRDSSGQASYPVELVGCHEPGN